MKLLYEAANNVEAHMILNLLEQEGLGGRIDGEFLQGGIGELPAGVVRVMVDERDYERAKAIVVTWDTAQPASAPMQAAPAAKSGKQGWTFAAGLLLGIGMASAYFRAPVANDGVDYNQDGVQDEKWHFSTNGTPVSSEADRNLDGKADHVGHFGAHRLIETSESDDDFDGVFESATRYRLGTAYLAETDTDKDGFRDIRQHYRHGVLVAQEFLFPDTGRAQKIDYYSGPKMSHSELDSNMDGKMDKRISYDRVGLVVSVEAIAP